MPCARPKGDMVNRPLRIELHDQAMDALPHL